VRRAACTLALPLARLAALTLSGCSRRAPERAGRGGRPDTLANGLPRLLVPKLADWARTWSVAVPDLAPGALGRRDTAPFALLSPSAGAPRPDRFGAAALIAVASPDSARSLDFDRYLELERSHEGGIELGCGPDSAPELTDFRADSTWRIAVCGTPCFYDSAYWADAERFALTGAMDGGDQPGTPWRAFLEVYDLRSRLATRWLGPLVDAEPFDRYREVSDSTLAARLAAAGR
jgi:hypothetical protein